MANDIAEAAGAILASLNENTAFPEHLARRFSLDEGYAVQFELLRRRKAQGDVHVGWKVGLTSRAMQLQQGVHEPCLGHLVEAGHVSSPAVFRFDELMAPGFENELCIRLGAPLDGGANAESARSAIDAIAPAIEVVEKRGVFNADLPLAFAGNAQQRAFVTGEFVPLADDADPATVEVEIFVNGRSQECALGAEVLGSPHQLGGLAGAQAGGLRPRSPRRRSDHVGFVHPAVRHRERRSDTRRIQWPRRRRDRNRVTPEHAYAMNAAGSWWAPNRSSCSGVWNSNLPLEAGNRCPGGHPAAPHPPP